MIQLLIAALVLLFLSFGWMRPRRTTQQEPQGIYAVLGESNAPLVRIPATSGANAENSKIYELRFHDPEGQEQRLICKIPTTQEDGYLYWPKPPKGATPASRPSRIRALDEDVAADGSVEEAQRLLIRQLRQENERLKRQVIGLSTQLARGRSTYGQFLN
jgi:hypothetical protein